MTWPDVNNNACLKAVQRVLDQNVTTGGPEVEGLELDLRASVGVQAVAVSSGTAGLEAALVACGVRPGEDVVVPALTFTATALAVLAIGARPAIADVSPEDWTLGPDQVRTVLKPWTTGVIPVDFDGRMADARAIKLAVPHAAVVVDACPSQGSLNERGEAAGTLGDASVFSFNQTKIVPAGEGGAVLSSRTDVVIEAVRALRAFGERDPSRAARFSDLRGRNYKMPELSAALARVGMARLEGRADACRINCLMLDEACEASGVLRPPPRRPGSRPRWHKYRAVLADPGSRHRVIAALREAGVPVTDQEVLPLHLHPALRDFVGRPCPVAERVLAETIVIGSRAVPPWHASPGEAHRWADGIASLKGRLR